VEVLIKAYGHYGGFPHPSHRIRRVFALGRTTTVIYRGREVYIGVTT
jgi:hypothetical protein